MLQEQRRHQRFSPKGVAATIVLTNNLNQARTELHGVLLDVSYSGIRIKLDHPKPESITNCSIQILLSMPKTGMEVTIKGAIRHMAENKEYGMAFAAEHGEKEVDAFLFECVKIVD